MFEKRCSTCGRGSSSKWLCKTGSKYEQNSSSGKEELQQKITALQQEVEQCQKEICSYASGRENLKLISDYFRARAGIRCFRTDSTVETDILFDGYVPTRSLNVLEKALNENFVLSLESADVPEDEEMPVLLSNMVFLNL